MNELITANQLADDEGKDPRTVELLLNRQGLQPVARLSGQKRQPFLWNKADALRIITQALVEGSKRK
jgi:hypothetical protein